MGWHCPKLQLWIWQEEVATIDNINFISVYCVSIKGTKQSQVFSTLLSGLRERDPVVVVDRMMRHGEDLKN